MAFVRRLVQRRGWPLVELNAWVEGLSSASVVLIALALTSGVAVAEELAGPDVSFTVLYLGPIAFATWFVSLHAGLVLSSVSALTTLSIELATRSTPLPTSVAAWNLAVQLGTFFALVMALSALKRRLEIEKQLARTDPLTLLANRRAFVEQAAIELERSRRTGRPITVAYIDCDDFKMVNDLLGHAQGDALLCKVASSLRGSTRAIDSVARLGGDEFGLLLVDADGATAGALINRLRSTLASATHAEGWAVSFSIGAATFVTPPRSVDDMLRHADQLMYAAKRSGKDGVRFEVVGLRPALSIG
jgi:diguanylate cyclase (GGDEF)-like protein